jgi:hypothetical protein
MFNGVALIVAVGISVWSGLGRQSMGKGEGGEADVDPAAAAGSGPNKGAVTTSVS